MKTFIHSIAVLGILVTTGMTGAAQAAPTGKPLPMHAEYLQYTYEQSACRLTARIRNTRLTAKELEFYCATAAVTDPKIYREFVRVGESVGNCALELKAVHGVEFSDSSVLFCYRRAMGKQAESGKYRELRIPGLE